MLKVSLIHGPNLNLLGSREPQIYGRDSFDEINRKIKARGLQLDVDVHIMQSNHEGEIIDAIHDARNWADGLVINPGALTITATPFGTRLPPFACPPSKST